MFGRTLHRLMVALAVTLALTTPGAQAQAPDARSPQIMLGRPTPVVKAQMARAYGKLPLAFEENRGQVADHRVKFLAHTPQGTLFLTDTEAVLALPLPHSKPADRAPRRKRLHDQHRPTPVKYTALRMRLAGANRPRRATGQSRLPGLVNYFIGRDPKRWHTSIPTYRQAAFAGVYPGVDMVYYGTQDGRLEYDFVVKAGADPKRIKLAFAGAQGVRVTREGDLALTTPAGEVVWHRPITYQVVAGHRQEVACAYRLEREGDATSARFMVARYDVHHPLIIDPSLQYSTYLGGSYGEEASGIVVDGTGNAYVTGGTHSPDFPVTAGAFQTVDKNTTIGNAFVTKLNATGNGLIYSTFVGGSGLSTANGIAVDSAGNPYITGNTYASDFPVTVNAFQTTYNSGVGDSTFVTKLNANGSGLIYSTYLGGSTGGAESSGIAVDGSGCAYVTGNTGSSDFPVTVDAFQTINKGLNAFITKLNADGTGLSYSTFLGGSGDPIGGGDYAGGIAVDDAANAYVTGTTYSPDFPVTAGVFQTTNKAYPDSSSNAFVIKLNASGSGLIYSTYLGGGGSLNSYGDGGSGIALDSVGDAYVTGNTGSSDFPVTAGVFQATNNGGYNAFVTKLNATGSALIYSTYLGGSFSDDASGITVDGADNAYVTGTTYSPDFPVTADAFQKTNPDVKNNYTCFLTELNASGTELIYSTYLGGFGGGDSAYSIALDDSGNAYVVGYTTSAYFPVTAGAFQTKNNASPESSNAFVSKFLFDDLMITNLAVTNITSSSATIRWNTNLNASTLVNYGTTTAYGSTATGAANVTTHTVTLTGLSPNTLYYFQVSSTGSGYTTTQTGSFLTSPQTAPQIVVSGYKFTRSGSDLFVDLTLTNTGTATAQNIQITKATLGTKTSSGLPVAFPAITAGGTYTLAHALHFNSADFPSGTTTVLSGSGTYNGGSYSAATRVTVP